MKLERNTTLPMILAENQRGSFSRQSPEGIFQPETEGFTAFAFNMRPGPGRVPLEGTPVPVETAVTEGRPVAADTRDGITYIFTQLSSGQLRIAASCDAVGRGRPIDRYIADPGSEIKSATASGPFLALLCTDGRVFYLHYLDGEWSAPGFLPDTPQIEVRATNFTDFTAEVEALRFPSAYTDLRGTVPLAVTTLAGNALRRAFGEASGSVRALGRWSQPVWLRAVVRLADGTALRISEPVYAAGAGWQNGGRISLPLTTSDKGFTGTAQATMHLQGWQFDIRVTATAGGWASLVKCIEIQCADQADPLADRLASVSYLNAESGKYLAAQLPSRATAVLENEGKTLPFRTIATLNPENMQAVTGRPIVNTPVETIAGEASDLNPHADAIAGHGAFMHFACGSTLITSQRGNPAMAASVTNTGSDITAIVPQPGRGGAYTRQLVYLFCSDGIHTLAHDSAGRHTNCRPISAEIVSDPLRAVSGDDCVWAVSDAGHLLEIRDTRATVRIRNFTHVEALAWDGKDGELWLIPEAGTWQAALVAMPGRRITATLRAPGAYTPVNRRGRLLLGKEFDPGKWRILMPSPAETGKTPDFCSNSIWRSQPAATYIKGAARVRFGIYGRNTEALVSTTGISPDGCSDERFRLASAIVSGSQRYDPGLPVMLPKRNLLPNTPLLIEHSVKGRIPRLEAVWIAPRLPA